MLLGPSLLCRSSDGVEVAQIRDHTIWVLPLSQRLTKQELELAQVEHFQRKVAANPNWAFKILYARDRPDFLIERGASRLGLDVAAFASTDRRRAADQFRKLKLMLMAQCRRGRLTQCKGIDVQLFFSEDRVPKPDKFEKAMAEFVAALERYKIDHAAWARVDGTSFLNGVNPYPMAEAGATTDGMIKWNVSGLVRRESLFSRNCGFNVEHQFAEKVSLAKVTEDLQRIIDSHDVPGQGIDELVLVVGGPDTFGEAVAGESTISELYFGHWHGSIRPPMHLNRIFVDDWFLGEPKLIFDRETGFLINAQSLKSK